MMAGFEVEVTNIGGIDHLNLQAKDSPMLVAGPNSTNKTSLLRAIAFGLGTDKVTVRSEAEEGSVMLSYNQTSVTRTARKTQTDIEISGESVLEGASERETFTHFGALLEFNQIRRAVRHDGDFSDILKSPIDVDELERQQSEKIQEKRDRKRELSELQDLESELARCEEAIKTTREKLAVKEEELTSLQERQSSIEDNELPALREKRGDLVAERRQYKDRIKSIEKAIGQLTSRRAEIEEQIDAATDEAASYSVSSIKQELELVIEERSSIDDRIDVLQSVLTANREMLQSEHTGILGRDSTLMEDSVRCWACGSSVPTDQFEEILDELESLIVEEKRQRQEYKPQVAELEAKISDAETAERRITDLKEEQRTIKEKTREREESLEIAKQELTEIEADIDDLDERIDEQEEEQSKEVADRTHEIEEARIECHTLEQELDRLEDRLETLREKRARRDVLEEAIETLSAEIQALTEKIERLEGQLQEEFNEAMNDLIDVLEFDKIERIWLDGSFEMVIVREIDGEARQDTLNHLSESEREMVGLVLALAGYVTYDLSDSVPFLLLDTIGAFDTERARRLIRYFDRKVDYLVVATRSEVAEELEGDRLRMPELTSG